MQTWTVLDVQEITDASGTIPAWQLLLDVPKKVDPTGRHIFIIPMEAVENRCAEYGFTTVDEALELLLYEMALAPYQASGELPMFNPASMDVVSAQQQAADQIAYCKKKIARIESTTADDGSRKAAPDPLQIIRDKTRIDPVRCAAIRMEIDRYRLARERAGRG